MCKHVRRSGFSVVTAALLLLFGTGSSRGEINPPLGPYIHLTEADFSGSRSFTREDLLVGTYFFYWYDVSSGAHIRNADGSDALTTHPPTLDGFSFKSRGWHARQLEDMAEAGVDYVLPVYWGAPSEREPGRQMHWSYEGLAPLIQARDTLAAAGKSPPVIGLFYDTSTLQFNSAGRHIDLTTDYGRDWFYESIRDFFSMIPPRHWAMIDGRPIILLYSAAFAVRHDQSCIDFVKTSFARDFGRVPYIVREVSWNVQADNTCAWGGALGLKNPGVASLGPGYDHSAVPGREPLVVDREGGDFFVRNWIRFLRSPSKIVMVETWNEFHEGTDIAESLEYGRQYIELTREYAAKFKAGERPPWPRGPYTDARQVQVALAEANAEQGLAQFEQADGLTAPAEIADSPCRRMVATEHGGRYLYFRIHDSFKWSPKMTVSCEIEFFDAVPGTIRIDFDGSDLNAPFAGAYTASADIPMAGTQSWKTAAVPLPDARFLNSQNGGADFRIAISAAEFYIRKVRVIRPGVPKEAGNPVSGFQADFAEELAGTWIGRTGAFQSMHGTFSVASSGAAPARLLASVPQENFGVLEVLARMRVVRHLGVGAVGGVCVAMNGDESAGFDFVFRVVPGGGRRAGFYDPALSWGPQSTVSWQTNTWYWIRMRHEVNPSGGAVDVTARVWPADGVTSEPQHWQAGWNYQPPAPPRAGLPGIVSGWGEIDAVVEFDYFLVQSPLLPEITAQLPGSKPALFGLTLRQTAAGWTIGFAGQAGERYALEDSPDLLSWTEVQRIHWTNASPPLVLAADESERRFFRTRWMP